jgi:hypothetical protein
MIIQARDLPFPRLVAELCLVQSSREATTRSAFTDFFQS